MLKEYLRKGCTNTFFFGASSILAKGLWLLCMPYILSKLPITDIGIFDFYQSIFLIGSLMISSLCALPLGRYYLKYRHDSQRQHATVGTSVTLVLVCATLCLGVSALALMRYTLYGDCYFIMFLMFNAALFSCFSFVTFFLQIREQLQTYMLLYVAQNVLALGIALMSIRAGYGISSLFWANGVSYLLCAPIFVQIFWQAGSFDRDAAREQITYGAPLLFYSMLYMLLFAVDRWYLAARFGYEVVGLYAVLWYFGRIFVYATMAIHDAGPMLLFNAQHEHEGTQIIARVIRYVTIVYVTGALMIVPCAYVILTHFLPAYSSLAEYMPLFIFPLLCVETGRFWQAGFNLASNTRLIPVISLIALLIQLGGLYIFGHLGIAGVLIANAVAYGSYMILNAIGSASVYSKDLFEARPLILLFGVYGIYNLLFWHALHSTMPLLWMTLGALTWLPALWFSGVVSEDERLNILQLCKKYLQLAW